MQSLDERVRSYEPFFGEWRLDDENPLLGEGSSGRVYLIFRYGRGKSDKRVRYEAALKVVPVPHDGASLKALRKKYGSEAAVRQCLQRDLSYIKEEIKIMKKLVGESNVIYFQRSEIRSRTDTYGWDALICMDKLIRLDHYFASSKNIRGKKRHRQMVLSMWEDVLRALSACERQHIVHLDVKPENIFYAPGARQFKLSDFGCSARRERGLAGKGARMGTLEYMAPEIYDYAGGDSRADVYSLALVVYEMLNNGRLPFVDVRQIDANTRKGAARHRLSGSCAIPPIKGVPEKVMAVLLRSLAYHPDDRFATAHMACEAVRRLRETARFRQKGERHMLLPALLVALCLGVVVMLLIGIMKNR